MTKFLSNLPVKSTFNSQSKFGEIGPNFNVTNRLLYFTSSTKKYKIYTI